MREPAARRVTPANHYSMWVKHTPSQTIFNTRYLHRNVFLIRCRSAVYSVVIPCAGRVYLAVIICRRYMFGLGGNNRRAICVDIRTPGCTSAVNRCPDAATIRHGEKATTTPNRPSLSGRRDIERPAPGQRTSSTAAVVLTTTSVFIEIMRSRVNVA